MCGRRGRQKKDDFIALCAGCGRNTEDESYGKDQGFDNPTDDEAESCGALRGGAASGEAGRGVHIFCRHD